MDFETYEQLNGLANRHHTLEQAASFIGQDGQLLFLALLAALFLARGTWRSRKGRRAVAAAGFSAILALALAQLIASLWDRPRPYEAHPSEAHLFLAPSPDPSFPSDHATGAYAIAFAILLRHRTGGIVALTLATLVAVARVTLGTHYPTDVLGGAALGAFAALTLWTPPMRDPLHRLADSLGERYERHTAAMLGRRTTAKTP